MKKRINIGTERLLLRPFEISDAPMVQKLAGDYTVADTTLNIPYPYNDGIAEEWISSHQEKFESGELINYAIIMKSENKLIGTVELAVCKRFNRAELGYWIGLSFWNKGFCTEASKAIINYGFTNFNFHKITASHILRNPASGKVMEKIGMKLEGTFRDHIIKWNKYENINSYGILKSEWEKINIACI